jgi:dienelactone hydrolase
MKMKPAMLIWCCGFFFAICANFANAQERLEIRFPSLSGKLEIPATVLKPAGKGPFPALVIAHDCSGLGPRSSGSPMRWAQYLVLHGFVVVLPDSFEPRGIANGVCTADLSTRLKATGLIRAGDALGALAALRNIPFIVPDKIGLMGGSHGGWTTLASLRREATEQSALAQEKQRGFAAAVALYPACEPRAGVYEALAPVLILSGELDDWTPAEPCREMAQASQTAGFPVQFVLYPQAHHGFDSDAPLRFVAQRRAGKGATTGGNPHAWADAKQRVLEFFTMHLRN